MRLGLPPEVLFPLIAGVVVLLAVVVVAVALRRGRSAADGDAVPPTAADWTGEAATGQTAPRDVPARRMTVADAVARRESAGGAHEAPAAPDDEPADRAAVGATGASALADPPVGTRGSGSSVAAAVTHALAARAAAGRESAGREVGARNAAPIADAKDRLLAVLFDDPEHTVAAVVDLDARRNELVQLATAVRDGRTALADALGRLEAAGLRPRQLASLAGISVDEVREALGHRSGAHSSATVSY